MSTAPTSPNGGDLPFARMLFEACDRLRGHVESAAYKHLVLGLIFLKYISDAFERRRAALEAETRRPGGGLFTENEAERGEILEDRDEYAAEDGFWVPPDARWAGLLAAGTQADVGARIDAALEAIEKANDELRGVLQREYARAPIAPTALGELLETVAQVGFGTTPTRHEICSAASTSTPSRRSPAPRATGGESSARPPRSLGRWWRCSSPMRSGCSTRRADRGDLFIQSGRFVAAHGGRARALSIYGLDDRHKDLRADVVLANPPFNMKKWGSDRVAGDVRWA